MDVLFFIDFCLFFLLGGIGRTLNISPSLAWERIFGGKWQTFWGGNSRTWNPSWRSGGGTIRVKPAFRSDRAGCARSIHCSRDVVCCRNEKIGLLQIRRPQNPSVFRHIENGLGRHPFHKTFRRSCSLPIYITFLECWGFPEKLTFDRWYFRWPPWCCYRFFSGRGGQARVLKAVGNLLNF